MFGRNQPLWRASIPLVVAIASGATIAAADAPKQSYDEQASTQYVAAYLREAQAARGTIAPAREVLRRFAIQTRKDCGRVLAGAPRRGEQLGDVEAAVNGMIALQFARVTAPVTLRFSRAIRGLAWTSRVLAQHVAQFAADLEARAARLPVSVDLCHALDLWRKGGFREVPKTISRFTSGLGYAVRKGAVSVEAQEDMIGYLLRRYETQQQRVIYQRAKLLVGKAVTTSVAVLYRAKLELFGVLGVRPQVY